MTSAGRRLFAPSFCFRHPVRENLSMVLTSFPFLTMVSTVLPSHCSYLPIGGLLHNPGQSFGVSHLLGLLSAWFFTSPEF